MPRGGSRGGASSWCPSGISSRASLFCLLLAGSHLAYSAWAVYRLIPGGGG
jgi:hypothetical protein